MKLYIYSKNDSWIISKTQLTSGWKYWSFVHVLENPSTNITDGFHVHYSSDSSRCMVSKLKNIDHWVYKFTFYASLNLNSYNTKLVIGIKHNPDKIKISTEFAIDGWQDYITIYTLNDLYTDPRITIVQNKITNTPNVSIAMAYFNRKEQFLFTLQTFMYSTIKDFEVVIADDASDQNNQLDNIINNYPFPIKLIKINQDYKTEKNYKNPSIIYNFAFQEVRAPVIIIQNPECCHVGDIINDALLNCKNTYRVYSCFNIRESSNNAVLHQSYTSYDTSINHFVNIIGGLPGANQNKGQVHWWYSHPEYRATAFHFTATISKQNLDSINGFDTAFAYGYWYDDDQIVLSIRRKGISVDILSPQTNQKYLMSIHQWHPNFTGSRPDFAHYVAVNDRLWKKYQI